jgi:hypothetical protein
MPSTDIRFVAPWLLPDSMRTRLPYLGLHNDLTALLKLQSYNNWIAIFPYTKGQVEFGLNCVNSYLTYGKAFNYIVYTFDDASLAHCQNFSLPCFNASSYLTGDVAA